MSNTTLRQAFKDIADAIRAKGVTGTMSPLEMPSKVASIPSGGTSRYGVPYDSMLGYLDSNGVLQIPSTPYSLSSADILGIAADAWGYRFCFDDNIASVSLPNCTSIGDYGM